MPFPKNYLCITYAKIVDFYVYYLSESKLVL